ncbi:MAG: class I SAM-dependent methyltransferase [Vicinamibacteria bacterium]|nr:class I SAM-dependent methyltransferase [Vicinamibacteria bacterium]
MRTDLPPELRCPEHEGTLVGARDDALVCTQGCFYPVRAGIPRFVAADNYTASFGLQWKRYLKTQLDSHTGATISRDRLARCFGRPLETLAGLTVLEAGCGAGRFTEVLLAHGARVLACDMSIAVEANAENCGAAPNYFVMQADIGRLPLAPAACDVVFCLGVLQHTPDPEAAIASLARQLKPGGLLVIDHYTYRPNRRWYWSVVRALLPRTLLRFVLIRLPPQWAMPISTAIVRALLPLHKLLWRKASWLRLPRRVLKAISPVFDYYDALPQLTREQQEQWSFLDTHDALTDRYKHLRDADEIRGALSRCGLIDIEVAYAGNGVEARAMRR